MRSSSGGSSAQGVVRALVDAWNGRDVDEICSFFHEDFENWQAPLPVVRGLAQYREHLRRWFDAYPDLQLEVVTLFGEGNLVCLETAATGRPRAPFFGVEPSSDRTNRALDVLEVRDGKVRRQRGYWDFSVWTGHTSPLAKATGP